MKEPVHLCDLFLNLWNGNINDLLLSFRFPSTYCVYTIQQLKHRLCMLLNHSVTAMDSHCTERRIFLFAPKKVIKQSDSFCLSDPRVCVCEQSDCPCPLQMCTQSGERQCLSDLILCEVAVSQMHEKKIKIGKLVRIVTKRESTRHRDQSSC